MKKVFFMLLLLGAAIAGIYSVAPKTNQASGEVVIYPTDTETPVIQCLVSTGLDNGRLNLRACAGMSCEVKDVLTEGELLQVIGGGDWIRVQTADSLTGYINSKFCKGK